MASPDAVPGETAMLKINLGDALQNADIFQFKAIDHNGHELYTWSWPVIQADKKAKELTARSTNEIEVTENENTVTAAVDGLEFSFNKNDGTIAEVKNKNGMVSFSGGPVPAGVDSEVTNVEWQKTGDGNFILEIQYSAYPLRAKWIVQTNGLLYFEAQQLVDRLSEIDYIGISFNYPEEKVKGVKWMGRGPYRVWKNRMKGSNFGVWEKEYNNTITGESFNNLVYPEFKGYHGNLYWATLETSESDFTIVIETPNLYFQLYSPAKPQFVSGGTHPPFPDGDLSFLYEIPAIGTKFKQIEAMGPTSSRGSFSGHINDKDYPIKLWFDFR